MISQIFKTGGGAGIGSFVLVLKDGALLNVSAEKVRWSYDSGENLYLSIIDDSTEEALLPLSGYVDNEGILHLSGRDFDDNKTYEITIGKEGQPAELNTVDGITMGEGTIPTEGGGGGDYVTLDTDQNITGKKTFIGETLEIKASEEPSYGDTQTLSSVYGEFRVTQNGSGPSGLVISDSTGDVSDDSPHTYLALKNHPNNGASIYVNHGASNITGKSYLGFPDNKGTQSTPAILATLEDCGSTLYRHHFNVHIDAQNFGGEGTIVIPVNAISASPVPWQTLDELDGNGFIVSAFGYRELPSPDMTYIFEINLFYKALNNGTLLLTRYGTTDHSLGSEMVTNMGSFALEDSVTKI